MNVEQFAGFKAHFDIPHIIQTGHAAVGGFRIHSKERLDGRIEAADQIKHFANVAEIHVGARLIWVGLDGNTTNDLVQAGTEQDAVRIFPYGTATNYYFWTEVYPLQPMEEVGPVSPGDVVDVTVYVGDAAGNVNPSGGYAWFNFLDALAGHGGNFSTKLPTTFGFKGNSAEWIVERPYIKVLSGYPELAQYTTFEMTGAVVLLETGVCSKETPVRPFHSE